MANEAAKLLVVIGSDVSGAKAGIGSVNSLLGGVQKSSGLASRGIRSLGSVSRVVTAPMNVLGDSMKRVTSIAAGFAMFYAFGKAFSFVADATVGFNSQLEQATNGLTTMLGSGKKAKAFLDQLKGFAAKTPFEFDGLVDASQRFLAMGINVKNIIPYMTAIGDAVAGLGGGKEKLDRVITALGQMNAKGKVSAEEMMQLTEAGIPAWDILSKAMGKPIPVLQKMVTKGVVPAGKAIKQLTDGMEKRFGGLMDKQSRTLQGAMSNISDISKQVISTAFKPMFYWIKKGSLGLANWLANPKVMAGAKQLGQNITGVFKSIADEFTLLRIAFKYGGLSGVFKEVFRQASDWVLKTGWPRLKAAVSSGASKLWDWVVNSLPGLLHGLSSMIAGAIRWLTDTGVPNLAKAIGGAFKDSAAPSFSDAGDWVKKTGLPLIWGALEHAGSRLWNWLSTDAWPAFTRRATDLFAQAKNWVLKTGLPQLWNAAADGASKLWDWVSDSWPSWVGAGLSIFTRAKNWVMNTGFPMITGWLSDNASKLWGWVSASWPSWVSAAKDTFTKAKNWVMNTGLPLVTGWLSDNAGKLWNWLQSSYTEFKANAEKLFGQAKQWVTSTGLPMLKGKATELWNWIQDSWPSFKTKALALFNQAKDWIIHTGLPLLWNISLPGAATKVWGAIIPNLPPSIRDKVQGAIDMVKGAFSSLWQKLQPVFSQIKPAISGLWQQLQAGAKQVWPLLKPALDDLKHGFAAMQPILKPLGAFVKGVLKGAFESIVPVLKIAALVLGGALLISIRVVAKAFSIFGDMVGWVGKKLAPFTPIVEKVGEVLGYVFGTVVIGAVGKAIQIFTKILGVVPKLGPVVTRVVSIVEPWITRLWGTFRKLWDITNQVFGWIAGKVLSVATSVGRVALGLGKDLLSRFNWISGFTSRIWNGITKFFGDTWNSLFTTVRQKIGEIVLELRTKWARIEFTIQKVWSGIRDWIGDLWSGPKGIYTKFRSGIDSVRSYLGDSWTKIHDKITGVWNGLRSWFDGMWFGPNSLNAKFAQGINSVKSYLSDTWDKIRQKALDIWSGPDGVKSKITGVWNDIWSDAKDLWGKIGTAIHDGIAGAAGKVVTTIQNVLNTLQSFEHGFANAVNSITDKLGAGKPVPLWYAPELAIPQYAKGTDWHPGGKAIVGERGPELVELPRGSKVIPNHKLKNMRRGADEYGIGGPFDFAKQWLGKAKSWAVDKLNGLGLGSFRLDLPGVFGSVSGAIISTLRDAAKSFLKSLVGKLGIGTGPGGKVTGPWVKPLSSYVVSQEFGANANRLFYGPMGHLGIDLAAPTGTPIYSPHAMKVDGSGFDAWGHGWGNMVTGLAGPLRIILGHMLRTVARPGQLLKAGQLAGYVDSTGNATGPHLDITIYRNGTPVNPRNYMPWLDTGGIIKRDTVAMVHRNEAVVPLPPGWRGGALGGETHTHYHLDAHYANYESELSVREHFKLMEALH